jgi:hypothetical protein
VYLPWLFAFSLTISHLRWTMAPRLNNAPRGRAP